MPNKISFLAFFLMWAERMKWQVPDIHIEACYWLEHRGELAVLRCFRGFGKSTILAVYNAWRYYCNPNLRILHQGDQDKTAYKTSRDTKAVLQKHPLTCDMGTRGEVAFWWVNGSLDERNPSMQASGILSNVTSSRADEVQNDDVEVPGNIGTPELREKLRYRLGEQTHIIVPDGMTLYIGTPHAHDSLYDELELSGADCLTIKMFGKEHRVTEANGKVYRLPFKPDIAFAGIGKYTRLLTEGVDYDYQNGVATFHAEQEGLIDFYADLAWPERFHPKELLKKRKGTRTINEWDSQYQLHSKPVTDCRLNPEMVKFYDVEPVFKIANKVMVCMLGHSRIQFIKARWDVASGQIGRDSSVLTVLLQDANGNNFIHRQIKLLGELDEQCETIKKTVLEFYLPHIEVESNGIGKFVPAILRKHLKGTSCSVGEKHENGKKHDRILAGLEPPLSAGLLWAHVSVEEGGLFTEMREFIPGANGTDDFMDSAAGAILSAPFRLKSNQIEGRPSAAFRPTNQQFEAKWAA